MKASNGTATLYTKLLDLFLNSVFEVSRFFTLNSRMSCVSGAKDGVGRLSSAAKQLWAEWEKRHVAGGEGDPGGGHKALEGSNSGQFRAIKETNLGKYEVLHSINEREKKYHRANKEEKNKVLFLRMSIINHVRVWECMSRYDDMNNIMWSN